MTCIVGVVANGRAVIGGDSAGVSGWDLRTRADSKVFRRGPFVMGFTSSFRMGQLLRFRLEAPEHPAGMDDYEYMTTLFVDAVRECLKEGGFARKSEEAESGGTFIVAYRGALYVVENDYQVGINGDGFAAVGCGDQVAMGSLYATRKHKDPEKRALAALAAAERFSAGVRGPFVVESEAA